MRSKKIGAVTIVGNNELLLKPHLDMFKDVDKHIVLFPPDQLTLAQQATGLSAQSSLSREIVKHYFPTLATYETTEAVTEGNPAALYNAGLARLQDCDLVLRLEPDMLFTAADFRILLAYLDMVDADYFRLDFANHAINYYQTGDFEHGLKDVKKYAALVVNPTISYHMRENMHIEPLLPHSQWLCHYFLGWNHLRSLPADWWTLPEQNERLKQYGNNGAWYQVPAEIRRKIELWRYELETFRAAG